MWPNGNAVKVALGAPLAQTHCHVPFKVRHLNMKHFSPLLLFLLSCDR